MTLRAHTGEGEKLELMSFDGKHFVLVSTRATACARRSAT